jgi:hypothetical protein
MEGKRKFFLLQNRIESWNIVVFGKIFWRSCFALVKKIVNFRKNLQKIIQKA